MKNYKSDITLDPSGFVLLADYVPGQGARYEHGQGARYGKPV